MNHLINFFLTFTNRKFSTFYKIIAMGPGVLIFLVLSPLLIFHVAVLLTSFIDLHISRSIEILAAAVSLAIGVPLMFSALLELWIKGHGTAAPIAPTSILVTTGPYRICRNPIELGTSMYFFTLGTYFDALPTGVLCLVFGLILGTGYIKLVEEKEMLIRFGKPYSEYLRTTPFMSLSFWST